MVMAMRIISQKEALPISAAARLFAAGQLGVEGVLPRAQQLNKHLESIVDQLRVHVTDILENKVGEADKDVAAPLRVVAHECSEGLVGGELELLVQVDGQAGEDLDQFGLLEERHEAGHE